MSSKGTRTERWTASAPDALCWKHWGEESVLYDRRSGQTHLLTGPVTECLLLLQDAALDLDELVEKIQPGEGRAGRELVQRLLLTLSELGLVTARSEQ